MTQLSFSDAEHAGKRKQARREVFLSEMEQVLPWKALLSQIEPHYPKAGRGRHPYALETMLRIHLLQQWYALSDPARGSAVRDRLDAAVCPAVAAGGDPGRDDDPELPPPAGAAWLGSKAAGSGQRSPAGQGPAAAARDDRGRDDHRCAQFDQEPQRDA